MKQVYFKITACLLAACFIGLAAHSQTVYDTIINRTDSILQAPVTTSSLNSNVASYLTTYQSNGSFSDLDYTRTDIAFPEIAHVENRVMYFAMAYTRAGSNYYNSAGMYDTILTALRFWYQKNPAALNGVDWYYKQVRDPQALGRILCLMRQGTVGVPQSLQDSILDRINNLNPASSYTGSNIQSVAYHYILGAALTQNSTLLSNSINQYFSVVAPVATYSEGFQYDDSYLQHGPQIMIQSYGNPDNIYTNALLFAGTRYPMPASRLSFLANYTLASYLRNARYGYFDFSVMGRSIGDPTPRLSGSSIGLYKTVDPANAAAYDAANAYIKTQSPPASEHKHYWLADYSMHLRPAYNFNVRTVSTRTYRTESLNGENLLGNFLPDGATDIQRRGDEYAGIYPIWEWDKIPGVTCRDFPTDAGSNLLDANSYGEKRGSTGFVGGVSDSLYGATAYDMNWDTVTAKKSWFYFDKEVVCLGAGINSSRPEPITTTVNQCWLRSNVTYSVNGSVNTLGINSSIPFNNLQWVLQDSVGYFFPAGGNVTISNATQSGSWNPRIVTIASMPTGTVTGNVFKLWLNHGTQPSGAKYVYIVAPGLGSTTDMQNYNQSDIRIVSNNDTIQAVRHLGLDMMQIVFYKAGTIADSSIVVSVSQPCIVLLKNLHSASVTMHIADPAQTQTSITVGLQLPGISGAKQLTVTLPAGNYKGQSAKTVINSSTPGLNNYRSAGTGVTVDLASATNWKVYNGTSWVNATAAPSGNVVAPATITILPTDTWQNNTAATTIPAGITLIDSSANFSTFSTTNKLANNGTIIFCASSLQTIPGQSALVAAPNASWGNLVINNTSGVTATQSAGNYFHVNNITLQSGTFTGGSSGGGVTLFIDGTVTAGGGKITTATAGGTNYGIDMYNLSGPAQTLPANIFVGNSVSRLTINNANGVNCNGTISASLIQLQNNSALTHAGDLSVASLTIDTLNSFAPLKVSGTATISGTVRINKFDTIPYLGQNLTLIIAGGLSGSFTSAAILPTGYTGTVANSGNNVVLTITNTPYASYRSKTAAGSSISDVIDWETFNGTGWVAATKAPASAAAGSSIIVRPGHIWNNDAIATIPAGVMLVDSSSAAASFAQKLTNKGTIVFVGTAAQTVPGQSSFGGTPNSTLGNIVVNNAAGVTSTQSAGNYIHINNITVQNGTFTAASSATSGGGITLFIDSAITAGNGKITTSTISGTNYGINMYGTGGPQIIPANTILSNTISRIIVTNTQGAVSNGPLTLTSVLSLAGTGATFTSNGDLTVVGLTINSLNSATTPVSVSGNATVSGTVTVTAFATPPTTGQQIIILSAGNISGAFNSTAVLPAGYIGTVATAGNNIILTITGSQYGNYRSAGTGVTVDLATTSNWQFYNGTTWVAATTAPSGIALYGDTILIRHGDTWQNNVAATSIPNGVILIDSSASFGTFSTTNKLTNNGTVMFAGSSLQTIPGAASLSSTSFSGGGGSWGNLVINNASGVTAMQGIGNYMHLSNITLQSGIFTSSGTGGSTLYVDGTITGGSGSMTTSTTTGTNFGVTMYGSGQPQTIPANTFTNNTLSRFSINNTSGVVLNGSLTVSGAVYLTGAGANLTANGNLRSTGISVSVLNSSVTPVTVSGNDTIDGTLIVSSFASTPSAGDQFVIVSAGTLQGTFSAVTLPAGYSGTMSYTGTTAILTISGAPGGMASANSTSKTIAVSQLNNPDIQLLPNPVVSNCTVQSKKQIQRIVVYDASGRIVKSADNINSYRYNLQMNGFATGTYFVGITGNGFKQTKTIIKK